MRELTIISGKGGSGKTSITASLAALAGPVVVADCDVDAANLHLLLRPRIITESTFRGGHKAIIDRERCIGCGACAMFCKFEAVFCSAERQAGGYTVDPFACEGCGVCVDACPVCAIAFPREIAGEWYCSETDYGPMVHARLKPGAENSGKLVSIVRKRALELAMEQRLDLVLIDGPPGVGCPVIASVAATAHVLVVTEPTPSGQHDLHRALDLVRHFDIPASVCINKWDLNPELSDAMAEDLANHGTPVVGRVRYDEEMVAAQQEAQPLVEHTNNGASNDIIELYRTLKNQLNLTQGIIR